MGATKTDEGFLPSRSLSVIEGLAKGFSMYGKELKDREIAKSQQMAETFKVIFPQYMMMMRESKEREFQRPYKQADIALQQATLQQTGQLGWAGLYTDMIGEMRQWNQALLTAQTTKEVSQAKITAEANMAALDRRFRTWFEPAMENIRTGRAIQVAEIGKEATLGAADIAATSRERIADDAFENQMRIQADEYRLKGELLDKELAAGKYAQAATDPILGQKFTNYRAAMGMVRAYAEAMTAMAVKDPEAAVALKPSFDTMVQNLGIMESDINRDLQIQGRTIPSLQMPGFETEPTGRWFWKGEKVVPRTPGAPAPARGATPGVSKTEDINKYAQQMVDNNWYMTPEDRARFRQLGVDPDAIEAEAKRRRKSK